MKAWIGNLEAYNNGQLIGEWIAIDTDENAIAEDFARICGDVEHYIADYDGLPHALTSKLGEYAGPQALAQAAQLMNAMESAAPRGVDAAELLDAFLDCEGYNKSLEDLADDAEEWVSDHFAGFHDSLEDFAAELLEDTGQLEAIPENLRSYFDFKAYGRDLELGGDVFTRRTSGGLLIFWNH
jgi:antirestriction protein